MGGSTVGIDGSELLSTSSPVASSSFLYPNAGGANNGSIGGSRRKGSMGSRWTVHDSSDMSYDDGSDSERDYLMGGGDQPGYFAIPQYEDDVLIKSSNILGGDFKLGTVLGVFLPCLFSILGVILFLRLGFIVGQAGIWLTLVMYLMAYTILVTTVTSISAISTNGHIRGGGAYFMISRVLGPEFGGSIGVIFYLSDILSASMYIIGFVEVLVENFGVEHGKLYNILPDSDWWIFGYGVMLVAICVLISLIGSQAFTKIFMLFVLVLLATLLTIYISYIFQTPFSDPETLTYFTGFNLTTFNNNSGPSYTIDPETGNQLNFQLVFGILFPSCTGVLAGSNMSGDLKNPSHSIPRGTFSALLTTGMIYVTYTIFTGFTVLRITLQENLSFLEEISLSREMIIIGILVCSWASGLQSILGASRVLQAIARDNLLPFTSWLGYGTKKKDEPRVAIIFSTLIIICVLFGGNLNAVAPVASVCYLLVYGGVNFACFLLDIAGAPNFRPTWQYFHWSIALFGVVSCIGGMFLINSLYAIVAILFMTMIFGMIYWWAPQKSWGDVSQALIYHQVRKYLLRLDSRKDHVKFWRPQILLLINNPRSSYPLVEFTNDLKKGGLFVLAHVLVGEFSKMKNQYIQQLPVWVHFVEVAKVKAFVEFAIASSIRAGVQTLLTCTGFGAMKPNLVMVGFLEKDDPQIDQLDLLPVPKSKNGKTSPIIRRLDFQFPPLRTSEKRDRVNEENLVGILHDAISLGKNIAVARGFSSAHRRIWDFKDLPKKQVPYIDIWPIGLRGTDSATTYTLVIQLGTILSTVWRRRAKLRVLCFVEHEEDIEEERKISQNMLEELRVQCELQVFALASENLPAYERARRHRREMKTEKMDSISITVESETSMQLSFEHGTPPIGSNQDSFDTSRAVSPPPSGITSPPSPTPHSPAADVTPHSPATDVSNLTIFHSLSKKEQNKVINQLLRKHSKSIDHIPGSEATLTQNNLKKSEALSKVEPAEVLINDGSAAATTSFSADRPANLTHRKHSKKMHLKHLEDPNIPPTAVVIISLHAPPESASQAADYVEDIRTMTKDLPPTLLVHGVTDVIATDL